MKEEDDLEIPAFLRREREPGQVRLPPKTGQDSFAKECRRARKVAKECRELQEKWRRIRSREAKRRRKAAEKKKRQERV